VPARAFITGITGMVGSHLADFLLAHTDWDVVGLSRWRSPMENIEHLFPRINGRDRITLVQGIARGEKMDLILQKAIITNEGSASVLKKAVGRDWKGKLSTVFYVVAIIVSPWAPWLSQGLYVAVALVWLVPDRRIEHALRRTQT